MLAGAHKIWFASASLLMLAGCIPSQTGQNDQSVTGPQPQIGRYTIFHRPQAGADAILLDTATGDTWEIRDTPEINGDPNSWAPVRRVETKADWDRFIKENGGFISKQPNGGWSDKPPSVARRPRPSN